LIEFPLLSACFKTLKYQCRSAPIPHLTKRSITLLQSKIKGKENRSHIDAANLHLLKEGSKIYYLAEIPEITV
jgi:hypothetical protein